ncbi:TPA: UvrD-helicase domain-containing protein [Yersinia enterocolitica]
MMDNQFTDEQINYINSSIDKHIFLEACPGSGKTEVVAAKLAKEIYIWNKRPGGIAVLSFANSATEELIKRVSKYCNAGQSIYPHFIGTFDSFIYKNIVSPLATELTNYTGTGNDATIRIVEPSAQMGYRTKYSYAKRGNIHAHHYSHNLRSGGIIFETGDAVFDRALNTLKLENWQIQDFSETKRRMLDGGFATYRDIEYLALRALNEERFKHFVSLLAKRYPLIIIDECQDLSEEQLTILQILLNQGTKLQFVGDLHQAIYGFREVEPARVKKFIIDNNFNILELTRNFRSCQNIVNLCAKLTGRNNINGNVTWLDPRCLVVQYQNSPTELTDTFDSICKNYNKNVIVSRGHSNLLKFQTSENELNNIQKLALAISIYNSDDMSMLTNSLQLFSEFIRHHLKESCKTKDFNCPYSVNSSISWRKFLCASLSYMNSIGLQNMNISWSNWVKQAKSSIRILSSKEFCPTNISAALAPLASVNLTSPSGLANKEVNSTLGTISESTSLYGRSTIHGAKGETHDVTIVVSSTRSGKDSHWLDWLSDPKSEAARFAYVASSRPQHYLIWAVKTLKNEEKKKLKAIGFTVLPLDTNT